MKKIILNLFFIITTIIQFLLTGAIISIGLGAIFVIILGEKVWQTISQDLSVNQHGFTLMHALIALLGGVVMFSLMLYITFCIKKLIKKLKTETFFVPSNIQIIHHILYSMIGITSLQLLVTFFFSSINATNVSDTFDFSLKDYWINFMLIIICYIAGEILKRGQQIQTDYDEII